jgi:hypothetical protein
MLIVFIFIQKKKENKIKTKQTKELNRRNSLTKKTSSKQTQTVQQIEKSNKTK